MNIEEKIEGLFSKWMADFETKPVKTGIKAIIIFYIIKYVYKSLFKDN